MYLFNLFFLLAFLTGCSTNEKAQITSFDEAIKIPVFKVAISSPNLEKMHEASTLLISCVDFRLRDETERLMSKHFFLRDDYDEVVLPGAALSLVQTQYPHWSKTLEDLVRLIERLHHIKRVIFLDHRGCGAYNLLQGKEHAETKEKETLSHKIILDAARSMLKTKFPNLTVHTLLMGLDGVVENIQ